METYYKILRNGQSCHGGTHAWEPGVLYEVGEVVPCKSGFHACRLRDLPLWLTHDMEVWEIELGEVVTEYNKVVGRTARLGKRLGSFPLARQVQFARWCANGYAAAAAADAADRAAAAAADASWYGSYVAAYAAAAADAAADAAAARADAAAARVATREVQGRKILELLQ